MTIEFIHVDIEMILYSVPHILWDLRLLDPGFQRVPKIVQPPRDAQPLADEAQPGNSGMGGFRY